MDVGDPFAGLRQLLGAVTTAGGAVGLGPEWEGSDFFSDGGRVLRSLPGGDGVAIPLDIHRADLFVAYFPARLDAVAPLIPAGLHPADFGENRTAIAIGGINYLETAIGPYGEVGVMVPCTEGPPAPGVETTPLATFVPGFGYYVLQLPVTTALSVRVGRGVWGFPKFLADIEFERVPGYQRVRLARGGSTILTLRVPQLGVPVRDLRPWVFYTVLGTELLKVSMDCRCVYQVLPAGPGARLELGDHDGIAHQLRGLGMSEQPLFTMNYLYFAGRIPDGVPAGAARAGTAPPARIGSA
ncbi:MAG TPA: acetoacetate decarboxylase family protein [Candidatus Dormibacteraeota bacterium]